MKLFLLLLCAFGIQTFVSAQNCITTDYIKTGNHWEITHYDKKGNFDGKEKQTVNYRKNNNGKVSWEIAIDTYNKKEENTGSMTISAYCKDGITYASMEDLIPAETFSSISNMDVETTIEGEPLKYPSNYDTATKLEDGELSIHANISGLNMHVVDVIVKDRQIEGIETITTEAGEFKCLKISQVTELKTKLRSKEHRTIIWYVPGFREVKSETRTLKGKLFSTSEITGLNQ